MEEHSEDEPARREPPETKERPGHLALSLYLLGHCAGKCSALRL